MLEQMEHDLLAHLKMTIQIFLFTTRLTLFQDKRVLFFFSLQNFEIMKTEAACWNTEKGTDILQCLLYQPVTND